MPDYLSQDMEMCPWPKKHFCSWILKQMEEKEEVWEGVGGRGSHPYIYHEQFLVAPLILPPSLKTKWGVIVTPATRWVLYLYHLAHLILPTPVADRHLHFLVERPSLRKGEWLLLPGP